MKKFVSLALAFCLTGTFALQTAFAATSSNSATKPVSTVISDVTKTNVINILEDRNIPYVVEEEGNNIKLKSTNPKVISEVNSIIAKEYPIENSNNFALKAASYPTKWQIMKGYNRQLDKKFIKASKSAFSAGVLVWLGNWSGAVSAIAKAAAGAFGTYYFVNTDEENVYYYTSYQYREVGPPYYDSMGNIYGRYEIQKTERTSKNSNWTGGQVTVRTEKSSNLTPFF